MATKEYGAVRTQRSPHENYRAGPLSEVEVEGDNDLDCGTIYVIVRILTSL